MAEVNIYTYAFDLASFTSGYALFKNQKLVTYGKFECNGGKGKRMEQFIIHLHTKFNKITSLERKDKKIQVLREDIYLDEKKGSSSAGYKTFKLLAQFTGIFDYITYKYFKQLPIEINTNTMKYACLGIPGKLSRVKLKKETIARVNLLFNLNLKYHTNKKYSDDDIADAIALGYWQVSNDKILNYNKENILK